MRRPPDQGTLESWSITVYGHRGPAPDLVVESPTVSASNPTAGTSFTLRATVRNNGGSAAGATTLRYYRSSDDTISTSDTSVGTDSVGGLAAGSTSAESISVSAPASAGTYYYGACVGAVTDESDTANNCSTAVAVTVGAATAPDLVVERAHGQLQQPADGRVVHAQRHGAQPGQRGRRPAAP